MVFAAIGAYPYLLERGSSILDRILIFHNLFHDDCKTEPNALFFLRFLTAGRPGKSRCEPTQ